MGAARGVLPPLREVPLRALQREPWASAGAAMADALRTAVLEEHASRREAATWLFQDLADAASRVESEEARFQLLLGLLTRERRERRKREEGSGAHGGPSLSQQLLVLACEDRPDLAVPLFAFDATLMRNFFRDQPERVRLWFDHFRGVGLSIPEQASPSLPGEDSSSAAAGSSQGLEGHRFGARSIARFAFRLRDSVWQHLAWAGRHAQSPVSVVARPHYLTELDVARTVRALVENVPEFWASPEFREDLLQGGAILGVDLPFFVDSMGQWLDSDLAALPAEPEERSRGAHGPVLSILRDIVKGQDLGCLLLRLLPLASEHSLLKLSNEICSLALLPPRPPEHGSIVVQLCSKRGAKKGKSGDGNWASIGSVLLCCACVRGGRQTLRMLQQDEEWAEQRDAAMGAVQGLQEALGKTSAGGRGAAADSSATASAEAVCLATFLVRALVAQEVGGGPAQTATVTEAFLTAQGVEFRREASEAESADRESDGEYSQEERRRRRRKKKGKHKHRKRKSKQSGSPGKRRKHRRPEDKGQRKKKRRRNGENATSSDEESTSDTASSDDSSSAERLAEETQSFRGSARWRGCLDGFQSVWEAVSAGAWRYLLKAFEEREN